MRVTGPNCYVRQQTILVYMDWWTLLTHKKSGVPQTADAVVPNEFLFSSYPKSQFKQSTGQFSDGHIVFVRRNIYTGAKKCTQSYFYDIVIAANADIQPVNPFILSQFTFDAVFNNDNVIVFSVNLISGASIFVFFNLCYRIFCNRDFIIVNLTIIGRPPPTEIIFSVTDTSLLPPYFLFRCFHKR